MDLVTSPGLDPTGSRTQHGGMGRIDRSGHCGVVPIDVRALAQPETALGTIGSSDGTRPGKWLVRGERHKGPPDPHGQDTWHHSQWRESCCDSTKHGVGRW